MTKGHKPARVPREAGANRGRGCVPRETREGFRKAESFFKMASGKVIVEVRLKNAKAVEELAFAATVIAELASSSPKNPQLVKAAKALRFAIKNLSLHQMK